MNYTLPTVHTGFKKPGKHLFILKEKDRLKPAEEKKHFKKVLFLIFYFEPDLSAGSFRNSPLAKELSRQLKGVAEIDVYTTLPNRYSTFEQDAPAFEQQDNLNIHRIRVPKHKNGLLDQVNSFRTFYNTVRKKTKNTQYDLIFASSSRLFTAFLGSEIANHQNIPFYVDVRDIFYDSMNDLLSRHPARFLILPFLKYVENKTFRRASHINFISQGFEGYFRHFEPAGKSFFTHGIDDEFLLFKPRQPVNHKLILYAGNIGEGQGLHKFIPQLAKNLEGDYEFLVLGDGGARPKLEAKIKELGCRNVTIKMPVGRPDLLKEYEKAGFFLISLNDYEAFKKVLPSKVFELASFDKPIIAGVGGYAADYMRQNIANTILVEPCDVESCTRKLKAYTYQKVNRKDFVNRHTRKEINEEMASSIAKYLLNAG